MTVLDTLHSVAPLVAVEAAAGCGKTWTAARFARECAERMTAGRVLLLSHTHAACGEFQRRCGLPGLRVTVETCDSFALKVIQNYARPLCLPIPLAAHVGRADSGVSFRQLSEKAVELFEACPTIARSIGATYPTIVLDEHQDSSAAQHRMVMLLNEIAGCRVRAFGDPMQAISPDKDDQLVDWDSVFARADKRERLLDPKRWESAPNLGKWIVSARETLKSGKPLSLLDAPPEVSISRQSNLCGRHKFTDQKSAAKQLGSFIASSGKNAAALAFLGPMVKSLAQVSAWRLKVNEGATLEHLDGLIDAAQHPDRSGATLSTKLLAFFQSIGAGISDKLRAGLEARLLESIEADHAGSIQKAWLDIFECVYMEPDHRGLAKAMTMLRDRPPKGYTLRLHDHAWALRSLADATDPRSRLSALSRLRRRRRPAHLVASTIHKAKGLEFQNVLVCPVDHHQYPPGRVGARLLYVAISRSTRALTLVLSTDNISEHIDTRTE